MNKVAMTWLEACEVARFLYISVNDLDGVPVKYLQEALVIIRARRAGINE